MKGLSSCAGWLMGPTLLISFFRVGPLQADYLVSSNSSARTVLPKSVFVTPKDNTLSQGSVQPVFGSGDGMVLTNFPRELKDQSRLAIQLLTTLVIPTGRLYNWPSEPTPTPLPPSTSPSPTPPSPPTTVPPSGGPPNPTPDPAPNPGPGTLQTPEPSSLLLAGLGISFIGWSRRRSRNLNQANSDL